ncbi:hypothetical protein Ciccas_007424 [Cichlidogyrus casuarinus]|uniref:Uncharacterized protein n=1 Tax=Cichlidogyrus casuarinus TaxID=1844966 RepID=A0ABD2Q2X5_9PLAT
MICEALIAHGECRHFEDYNHFHNFVHAAIAMFETFHPNDPFRDLKLKELMSIICSKRLLKDNASFLAELVYSTRFTHLKLDHDIIKQFLQYHLEFLVSYLPLKKLFPIMRKQFEVQCAIEFSPCHRRVVFNRSFYQLVSQMNTRLYIHKEDVMRFNYLPRSPESKFYFLRDDINKYNSMTLAFNFRDLYNGRYHWIEKIQSEFKNCLKPFKLFNDEDIVRHYFSVIHQFDLYNEPFFGPLHELKQHYDLEANNRPCFRIPD